MISIIIFSKGRPMQLHAYLESLLRFSDAQQSMITVLYCDTEGIRYDKVMQKFPEITWVKESKFETDLKKTISQANDYIMFGCDDVVFTRKFSLEKACEYLKANEQVFGFSMRLGANIKPMPENLSKDSEVLEWKWEGCKEAHYNYPWELDCTVYRKEDVLQLTGQEELPIKNPNYYEAMITEDNRSERIVRKHMAANKQTGCAIVITVNRVQDTHQNGFDDSMLTDIYSLDKLYNDEDNYLDLDKISSMDNDIIHVGAEYFILKKQAKGYSQNRLWKKKAKALQNKAMAFPKRVYRYCEKRKYLRGAYEKKLHILNTDETLSALENMNFSFLRFGDGEIAIANGQGIPFQEANESLGRRLKELLTVQEEGLKVGIPYYYMHPIRNMNAFVQNFAYALGKQRKYLLTNCNKESIYIDTCLTQVYQTYADYDFDTYYVRMQKLLEGKDVTVICGEGVLDKLQYRALDVCNSVEYVYGPSMNAYSEYDKLLEQAKKIDKNRLVLAILGPTAKVLVYDLYKAGYTAWDMGHYLKDYDAYKRQRPRTEAEITQFYKPD